jgi:ribosomal protein S18 acetylase RimI-like enzyme
LSNILYSLATPADAPILATYRIDFLSGLLGPQPAELIEPLQTSLTHYFAEAISDGSYISYVARSGNDIAGMGGMVLRTQPGNFKNPSGRVAYIMNMYTVPTFRKLGICTHILNLLADAAKATGIYALELHATADGEPLYIKNNFRKHHEPTYRRYDFTAEEKG